MHLYTLTKDFIPRDIVGDFTSAIWTERYSTAGDMELVVPATKPMMQRLSKGTLLGLRGTKEIMILDTQTIKNGLLTVKGYSLLKFLNERQAWFPNPLYDGESNTEFTAELSATTTAGPLISDAVFNAVIRAHTYTSPWTGINLDWTRDKIPGLELGAVDNNGTPKRLAVGLGPLYDSISRLAQDEGLGLKLYLSSATYSTKTFVLKFATYRGKDRTSGQTVNGMVRLTPKLDSLADAQEVSSLANYKNVIYVNYKDQISIHYTEPTLPIPEGFNRRILVAEAPDIYLTPDHIADFRAQVARNEAAKHVYLQSVDGQISGQIGYTFGIDYHLGDIIELEGLTGVLSKARITEYIRSQDEFGERAYPTLDVIDPLFIGYMPDVEPDPDEEPDWEGDPDYDLDPIDDDTLDDTDLDPDGDDEGDGEEPEIDPNPEPDPDPGTDRDPDGDGDGGPSGDPYSLTLLGDFRPLLAFGYLESPESIGWFYPAPEWINYTASPAWKPSSDAPGGEVSITPLGVVSKFHPDPEHGDYTVYNLIAVSQEEKLKTAANPWTHGYTYWLVGGPTAEEHKRLTDTATTQTIRSNSGSYAWEPPGCYYYADSGSDWWMTKQLSNGSVELHHSTNGKLSGMQKILGPEDFPDHPRDYLHNAKLSCPPVNPMLMIDVGGYLWACSSDGSDLRQLDQIGPGSPNPVNALGWTPSGILHGITASEEDGRAYSRYFTYNTRDEIEIVMDYSMEEGPFADRGPFYANDGEDALPVYSPDGTWFAYVYQTGSGPYDKSIRARPTGGGVDTDMAIYPNEFTEDINVLSPGKLAWDSRSATLMVVDSRPASRVVRVEPGGRQIIIWSGGSIDIVHPVQPWHDTIAA